MDSVSIYTDGAARGNPGPGGYGVVLSFTAADGVTHEKELSGGFRLTTNNRMELMAALVGLRALSRPCSVILYSDSQYLVNAFNQHWIESWIARGWKNSQKAPVKNVDLWKQLLEAAKPHQVRYVWVKGHAGQSENERCDQLATSAADGQNLAIDEIFEQSSEGLGL